MSDDQPPATAGTENEADPADSAGLPRRRLLQALGGAAGLASVGLPESGPVGSGRAQSEGSNDWTQQQKLTQSGDYDITVEGSVQIPTREAPVEGSTFQVSAVAKQNSDADYTISVDAPSSANYNLLLKRGSDYRTVQVIERGLEGDYSAEFDMIDLDPSTYYIALESNGIQEVHPLVVRGYSVDITADGSVEQGGSVDVSLSLSEVDTDARNVEVVEAVLGDDSEAIRVNASLTSEMNYQATVNTNDLSPGTYSVYGVVRGPQEVQSGELEILAVSDRQDVTVTGLQSQVDRFDNNDRPGIQVDEVESGINKFNQGTTEDGEPVSVVDVERLIAAFNRQ